MSRCHTGVSRKEEGRCRIGAMRREIKKSFWVNAKEDYEIKTKAQAACLSEAEFFRQLCKGYTPTAMPDERFWQAMDLIREFADRIDAVAIKADSSADVVAIMAEAKKWRMFQNAIEMEFLRPKRGES